MIPKANKIIYQYWNHEIEIGEMKERLNELPKEELIDLLEDLTMRVPGAMNFIVHGVENSSED